jgi:hypothetical protein
MNVLGFVIVAMFIATWAIALTIWRLGLHIHVQSADGEAKFWLEPTIELARNHLLTEQDLGRIARKADR